MLSANPSLSGCFQSFQTFLSGLTFFFFCSCDQKYETKEKEDAAMPVKKGAGKGKVVKVKQETLPTPQGRRVIPRITSTMKAEANRKADIKKGEGKRGKKIKVCLVLIRPDKGCLSVPGNVLFVGARANHIVRNQISVATRRDLRHDLISVPVD